MSKFMVESGAPEPLGAACRGEGTNFALYSERAENVELLIFEPGRPNNPAQIIQIKEKTGNTWHCFVHGVAFGYLYAYRVRGPYEPEKGLRFNPSKVLIDPYARAVTGPFVWDDSLLGYRPDDYNEDLSFNSRDSCAVVPKSVIVDPSFDWQGDSNPATPWERTVIYETHVKGVTAIHPKVPEEKRGTFAGLASPCVIDYLRDLGVTAVELLPVHQSMDELTLRKRNLTNYWGYNTIGFFAPDARYSSSGATGGQVREFKEMVRAFHRAGIEVIIDAVYNHSAESDELGPTVCFRGIDNISYYHLNPEKPRRYMNYTGCGNSIAVHRPHVERLVLDSLRYWVEEMHVDGFRFDLAVTLSRMEKGIDDKLSFFNTIVSDPVLKGVKLIAEPWDIGEGGYRLGKFPPSFSEWNDKYRDTVRRFWKGDSVRTSDICSRFSGSPDIFSQKGQSPLAGINYITAHDGFTLYDLVSYNGKHNIFNMEGNRDGANENLSWNSGEEGATENQWVCELRERRKKNFIATLLFSQGVPMILGGDEMRRTQRGNNNAYCQDNRITWYDWDMDDAGRRFLDFTKNVIRLRNSHPVFRLRRFLRAQNPDGSPFKDVTWIKADGIEINDFEWNNSSIQALGMVLNGAAAVDDGGQAADNTFLILMNACHTQVNFTLPGMAQRWELVLYTNDRDKTEPRIINRGDCFSMAANSLALFRMV